MVKQRASQNIPKVPQGPKGGRPTGSGNRGGAPVSPAVTRSRRGAAAAKPGKGGQ